MGVDEVFHGSWISMGSDESKTLEFRHSNYYRTRQRLMLIAKEISMTYFDTYGSIRCALEVMAKEVLIQYQHRRKKPSLQSSSASC